MLADAKHVHKKQGKDTHSNIRIAVIYTFISLKASNGSKEKMRKNRSKQIAVLSIN